MIMSQEFISPSDNPLHASSASPVGNPTNILSVFFVLFGAYLFVPSFQTVYVLQVSGSWPVVEARVVSSEVEKKWPDRDQDFDQGYLARVWYRYDVEGTQYLGHNLQLHEDYSRNLKAVEATVSRYPVGETIKVHHDPKDPAVTVVERGSVPSFDCLKLGLGMMFIFCGTVALLGVMTREGRG